jgi:hypothetical protein
MSLELWREAGKNDVTEPEKVSILRRKVFSITYRKKVQEGQFLVIVRQ